jgi:hypothetical protein
MKRGRLTGIVLTTAGLAVATLGGISLALQPSTLVDDPSLIAGILPVFFAAFVLMLLGGYDIVVDRAAQTADETEMELPLRVLDFLRQHGEVSIEEVAQALGVSPDRVTVSLEELQSLQLFSGYVRPQSGHLRAVSAALLESTERCLVCSSKLQLVRGRSTVCSACDTAYYLPEI